MANTAPLVLIVEDENLIRELAVLAVEEAGFEVVEAATAEEALDILRIRSDIGVVFTDVNMPGQFDGLDLARFVHDHWPKIRLVVTSGRPLSAPVPEQDRFMAKPYSLDQLTLTVSELSSELD